MTAPLNRAADVAAVIAARLAMNTTAQGAETDIGATVYRGKRNLEERLFPCAVLIEGADTPKDQTPRSAQVRIAQRYVLQAYLACDANHPNDAAHAALRDLKRCVFTSGGKPDSTLGGAVQAVEYLGRDIAARVDGAGFVSAAIEISITYSENLAGP